VKNNGAFSDGPRSMAFTPDGLIRRGARWSEVTWNMLICDDGPLLVLNGQNRVSVNLRCDAEGNWSRVSKEAKTVLRPIAAHGRFGVTL